MCDIEKFNIWNFHVAEWDYYWYEPLAKFFADFIKIGS